MSQLQNVNEFEIQISNEEDIVEILRIWEQNYITQDFDPEIFVRRLADIFQNESIKYLFKDPDPFDEV